MVRFSGGQGHARLTQGVLSAHDTCRAEGSSVRRVMVFDLGHSHLDVSVLEEQQVRAVHA